MPGSGLAHAVYRETDGNPFFVGEVLRHLSETGAIHQDAAGRWVAEDSLEQIALPDSVREVIGARVARLGKEAARVLSVAAVIGRDFDLDLLARATPVDRGRAARHPRRRRGGALVREQADTPGATRSPMPSSSTRCTRTSAPTAGPGPTGRWPRPWRTCAGTGPGTGSANWPATGCATQPIDLGQGHRTTRARPATPPSRRWPRPTPSGYYAQALDLYPQVADPDPDLGLDLAIGLGTAQRQTGEPAYRRPSSRPPAGRPTWGTPTGWWRRHWPTTGAVQRGGDVDTDKVAVLQMALDRLRHDDPTGPSCSVQRRAAAALQALS